MAAGNSSLGARAPAFLDRLGPDDRAAVLGTRPRERYRDGETLLFEGQHSATAFVLMSGWVKVVSHASEGEVSLLGLRGPGELVGEMSLVIPVGRTAGVVAMGPVGVVCLPHDRLAELLRTRPQVSLALLAVLAARLRHADRWRAWAGALRVSQRLAIVLLELTDGYPPAARSGGGWKLPFTAPDLAGFIATSARSVQRALLDLRSAGIVESGTKEIEVLSRDRLKASVAEHLPPGWVS